MSSSTPLSPADLAFFEEHGWCVARSVISRAQAARTAAEIWKFDGRDPDDASTWSAAPLRERMVHGVEQWNNRTAPGVHGAFAQLFGTPRLWCTHDVVGIKLPLPPDDEAHIRARETGRYADGLHWDTPNFYTYINTIHEDYPAYQPEPGARNAAEGIGPIPFQVQGVLYLVDVPEDNGAFYCVDGFHKRVDPWLRTLAPDTDPKQEDLLGLGAVRVAGNAGDLVIWQRSLPHTGSINIGTAPRVVQYITMNPANAAQDEASRAGRIQFWDEHSTDAGDTAQPAQLTPLGRRIAGLEPWPGPEQEEGFPGLTADWRAPGAARL